jgi:hypothetical protein
MTWKCVFVRARSVATKQSQLSQQAYGLLSFALGPPLFPQGGHVSDLLRMLPREIVQFRSVFIEIVEFPVRLPEPNQFPIAHANGFSLSELPVEHIVRPSFSSLEDGQ